MENYSNWDASRLFMEESLSEKRERLAFLDRFWFQLTDAQEEERKALAIDIKKKV